MPSPTNAEPRASLVPIGQSLAAESRPTPKRPNRRGIHWAVTVSSRLVGTSLQAVVLMFGMVISALQMDPRSPQILCSHTYSSSFFLSSSASSSLSSSSPFLPTHFPRRLLTPSTHSHSCIPYLRETLSIVSSSIHRSTPPSLAIYRWLKLMVCYSLNHTEQSPQFA